MNKTDVYFLELLYSMDPKSSFNIQQAVFPGTLHIFLAVFL